MSVTYTLENLQYLWNSVYNKIITNAVGGGHKIPEQKMTKLSAILNLDLTTLALPKPWFFCFLLPALQQVFFMTKHLIKPVLTRLIHPKQYFLNVLLWPSTFSLLIWLMKKVIEIYLIFCFLFYLSFWLMSTIMNLGRKY